MNSDMPSGIELEAALLRILSVHAEGMHTREMKDAVAGFLNLSPRVMDVRRAGNRKEFAYRLAWARTKAQQKKLIERIDVAVWRITEIGKKQIKI